MTEEALTKFLLGCLIVAVIFLIKVLLSVSVSNYAQKKGYSKILFFCLSFFCSFIITLIVALCCEDKTKKRKMEESLNQIRNKQIYSQSSPTVIVNQPTKADDIQKYYDLYKRGAITQEEYEKLKNQILN